ncbi:MAG: YdcF family protein [Actinobacteria bacterium]|nr:YdcF family protein [Actinomycetota bacterium]
MDRHYEGMSIREITDFLFVQDDPEPADLVFVFGGQRQERALKAAQLYKAGFAPKVFISGGDKRGTGEAEAESLKRIVASEGVPEKDIITETRSSGTLENVLYSQEPIEKAFSWRNLKKVILVSAPMHMRRVKRTFARHCHPELKIICCPDDREDVNRDNWWTTEVGRKMVLRELEKVRAFAKKGEL